MDLSIVDVSRWQFGITTVYHFIFVPLTIGLAPLIAIMQTMWVTTGKAQWYRMTRFFGNLFVINFAMGVVTGIVQEFQFGMNWSEYSRFVGDIFGAPLAMEGIIAFFFESTFIGLWMFGWDKLNRKVHLATIWIVAIAVNVSAYFIIVANSFMQHPVGAAFNPESGRAELESIGELLTNNTALNAFPHVFFGGLITAATFVVGISGWWMVRQARQEKNINETLDELSAVKAAETLQAVAQDVKDKVSAAEGKKVQKTYLDAPADVVEGVSGVTTAHHWRSTVRFGSFVLLIAAVGLFITGDMQAKLMFKQQPMKMASAESLCETAVDPSFSILTIGDANDCDSVRRIIELPVVLSFLAEDKTSGVELKGVENLQKEYEDAYGQGVDYRPNLFVTYWSFRLMIGLILGSLAIGIAGLWVTRKNRTSDKKWFSVLSLIAIPFPFLANAFGWIFTEMGRQPWIVHPNPTGPQEVRMLVAQGVSNNPTWVVWMSMIGFTVVYGALAVVWFYLIQRYVKKGATTDTGPSADTSGYDDFTYARHSADDSAPEVLSFGQEVSAQGASQQGGEK